MFEDKKGRRKATIYDHFIGTPEEVDTVVSELSDEDQELFNYLKQQYINGEKFDRNEYGKSARGLKIKISRCLRAKQRIEEERLAMNSAPPKVMKKLPNNKKD